MRDQVALHRYLQRHTEPGLPVYSFTRPHWQRVLVIPAYREAPALLEQLARVPPGAGSTLVILVLNRPDSDSDPLANADLRDAVAQSGLPQATRDSVSVYCLNPTTDLYLYDLEMLSGPTAQSQGVGLARKTGCDLALHWKQAGGIGGEWLYSTDADAILPQDFFAQLDDALPGAVAAVFPFRHMPGADKACNTATALYELRLHHYVLGLEYARSPYAFHTLGSALAIRFGAYAHAHGFPKRAGAEDFYLLNKLAKLGPVAHLQGRCIELQSRRSTRVPFGTGPAVAAIMAAENPHDTALFYHPQCFEALAAVLAILPALAENPGQDIDSLMRELGEVEKRGQTPISAVTRQKATAALTGLGIAAALDHCRRQANSSAQFSRQFHQWFDGFRTLKFIHALRDGGLPLCSLAELDDVEPSLWPSTREADLGSDPDYSDPNSSKVEALRQAVRDHWHWR
ncbi:MAG: hypothetical protein KDI33_00910 [Halioglobus sp.]|nr:hypothetical protein [Halioglobus sp.]